MQGQGCGVKVAKCRATCSRFGVEGLPREDIRAGSGCGMRVWGGGVECRDQGVG